MVVRRKIAFYRPKALPISNGKLYKTFEKQFREYHVDLIDIEARLSEQLGLMVVNSFHTLFTYGIDILMRRKKIKEAFWRTPLIFRRVKKFTKQQQTQFNYSFTFQVQSLYDCSVEGVQHFVYTDHTHLANLEYSSFNPSRLFPQSWIDLEKTIYKNASLVFVRSSNIKRSLLYQYQVPTEKIECVYAGRNADVQNISTVQARYERQSILFVGVDWRRKGGPVLVEAFKLIKSAFPKATLTIVGCNPHIDLPGVHVVGRVSLEKLTEYYQLASIFCLPTTEEPFGIAFLEAMSAGMPIIGTQVGAIPDFIIPEINGLIIPPNDIVALTESLGKLLKDASLCQQYGLASLNLVNTHYSWPKVSQKIQNHIETVISNR